MDYPDMVFSPLTHKDWTHGQAVAENLKHTCTRCRAIDWAVDGHRPLCKPCHDIVTADRAAITQGTGNRENYGLGKFAYIPYAARGTQ